MKESEQKTAAKAFAAKWQGIGDEKQHTQTFWLELLQQVYGVSQPFGFITFEDKVKLGHVSFIDARISETHVIIEQKSLGKDLSKPIQQSDGTFLTPYQQAKRYADEQPYSKRPRWIVACNFAEFRVYDMEHPGADPEIILLKNLEHEAYRLQFLVNVKSRDIVRETQVSKEAGVIVGRLYDALLKEYKDPTNPETLKSLNKLCVRLVFLLYAESAGVLGKRNMFREYLLLYRERNMRRALLDLFEVLATKPEDRDAYMDDELAAFPYVNGGLFDGEKIEIPKFTPAIIDLLIHQASEQFDWSAISAVIFGAVFESTLNPVTRRAGGMHYTSIENIHKVIDPLFLDDLKKELSDIKSIKTVKLRRQKLTDFQNKLASIYCVDPACGSGNFLTESYISLRRLENEVISELMGGEMTFGFAGEHNPIKVSIDQFYGIEINDFAVTVSKTALWIAESQALQETENIIHLNLDFLPLKTNAHIVEGNALRMDWTDVIPKEKCCYIFGNPPFVGASMMSAEQKSDAVAVFGEGKLSHSIDYVGAWYHIAAKFMQGTNIKTAFVSTNSITQGEQVVPLWSKIMGDYAMQIIFAHRTFRWDSESKEKAAVHCVIMGICPKNLRAAKRIYSGSSVIEAENISPYIVDAPDILVESRSKPLCDVPKMLLGNKPSDGGNLILTAEEKKDVLSREPQLEKYIRPYVGANEYINKIERYCFWLVDIPLPDIRKSKELHRRLEAVKAMREKSTAKPTREKANTPHLFFFIAQPTDNYIIIPRTSSERRRYIPIGFLPPSHIVSQEAAVLADASLYHFGVLISNVHMAWMRTVAGRLKSDYRYSKSIVYNCFPWPTATEEQKSLIEKTAQGILDARNLYPNYTLADLYDEVTMPPELRKAHQANDRAVMQAYGFDVGSMTEASCVAELMKMYRELAGKA